MSEPSKEAQGPAQPSDDVKDKFREALDKKREQAHRSTEAAQTENLRGSEVMGATRRVFRRKSG